MHPFDSSLTRLFFINILGSTPFFKGGLPAVDGKPTHAVKIQWH